MASGPKALNEALIAALPDEGPVVMVNLVRLRERSLDGDGSGWDAYVRYSNGFMPLLKACGGTILWAGNPEGLAFGDLGDARWDYIVLVRYPSRADFLRIMTSPEYAVANTHRENGLEDHVIFSTRQTYSKF
jgi:uncharacterized protein (DUF1330 family)